MSNVLQITSPYSRRLLRPRPSTPRLSSVLVHVGTSSRADDMVIAAGEIANTFGAKLIGVSTSTAHGFRAAYCGVEAEAIERLLTAAGERFSALGSAVRGGIYWQPSYGSPVEALCAFGWAADLIIVDHADVDAWRPWSDDIETLLTASGRPVLVRSRNLERSRFDRVVVAWDDSAACARATLAALPFFGRASGIVVLAPPWRRRRQAEERQLEDMHRGLLARDLPVHVERLEDWSPGRLLVDRLNAMNPDLVVMGGRREYAPWNAPGSLPAIVPYLKSNVLLSG